MEIYANIMSQNETTFTTITKGVLTICTYTEFAPFSYEYEGQIVGTDINLLRDFATEMKLKIELKKNDFAGLWETPGNNECDISAAGMMEHEDRHIGENAVWSDPYMVVTRSLLIRRSDIDIFKYPENFKGQKIVVTPSSSADIDGRIRYKPLGANIIPVVPSQNEIVSQLLSGEIDAFGEGDVSNEYLAGKYLDENGNRVLALADMHSMDKPELLRFCVRSVDERLPYVLNKFIRRTVNKIEG